MKDETRQWLDFAVENIQAARILLQSELFNACLQNTQQAVEKTLKALLIERGIPLRKTHSISELVKMLESVACVNLDAEECDLLDSIFMPSRYPLVGLTPQFDPDINLTEKCLAIGERLIDQITEGLGYNQ